MSHIARLALWVRAVEHRVVSCLFGHPFPPSDPICVVSSEVASLPKPDAKFTLKDIIGDGFLYAVPKFRRSVEKRLKRKFGHPEYVLKILTPKTYLRVCNTCGNHHEAGVLCKNCYERVKQETKEMKEQIQANLGLKPIENDVIVLYEGEKLEQPEEFWKGKRIVEMKKPRPSWFSKNLLQKSTQQPATTTDVKPTELA